MRPPDPTLDRLIREAEDARLEEAVLETTGGDLLDRARTISHAVEERLLELTAAPGERGPDAYP
jgi:hypothetical protein